MENDFLTKEELNALGWIGFTHNIDYMHHDSQTQTSFFSLKTNNNEYLIESRKRVGERNDISEIYKGPDKNEVIKLSNKLNGKN